MQITSPFQFPSFKQVYPFKHGLGKRFHYWLNYQLFRRYSSRYITQFSQFVNNSAIWCSFFKQYPFFCLPLIRHFGQRNLSQGQRLAQMQENLEQMEKIWGEKGCKRLISEQKLLIFQQNEITLHLTLNTTAPELGFFAFELQMGAVNLYRSTFILLEHKLLISSMQGATDATAVELAKQATKQLFGVRPMIFMLTVFKLFSQQWQRSLVGVSSQQQILRNEVFNYDEFWRDHSGTFRQDEWQIDNQLVQKPLEEISSKKRALYRRRYAMLETLAQTLARSNVVG